MKHVTRRNFAWQMAGLAATTRLRAADRVSVVAHPWVYAAPLPGYDLTPVLDTVFSDLQYAGVDGLELMHTALRHDDAVSRIGELSRKYGVPVTGTSYEANMWNREEHAAILPDATRVIERAAKLGGHTFGTSVGDARRRKTPRELDAQAELVRKLMRVCSDNGVVLNLHNHIYEVKDDEHDLKGTLARIPESKLGPDLDWLIGAHVDPVDFLRRYRDRIVYAHVRDRKADGVWPEAMGEGATDFAAIGREFHHMHFHGSMAIELAHPTGFRTTRPLRESIKTSREYVRRVMGY